MGEIKNKEQCRQEKQCPTTDQCNAGGYCLAAGVSDSSSYKRMLELIQEHGVKEGYNMAVYGTLPHAPILSELLKEDAERNTVQKQNIESRTGFDDAMMIIAVALSTRGTCRDRAVGCVLTRDKRIVGTGYNGAVPGAPHCQDVGCLEDDKGRCIRCNHAEVNACMQLRGQVPDTAYCTLMPCLPCLRTMYGAGVRRILYCGQRIDKDVKDFIEDINKTPEQLSLSHVGEKLTLLIQSLNSNIREYLR